MLRRLIAPIVLPVLLVPFASAESRADHRGTTFRYPRVYGATGRPYGPTQAHYQYERQYGRPWHGEGGNTVTVSHGRFGHHHGHHSFLGHLHFDLAHGCPLFGLGGYGFGSVAGPFPGYLHFGVATGPPGLAGFGPADSYLPMAPTVLQAHPFWLGPSPHDNAAMHEALRENDLRWKQPLEIIPDVQRPRPIPEPSTPAAKLSSLRAQGQGDHWMQEQKFLRAAELYRKAVRSAPDRAEAHFRLALAQTALGSYASAVQRMKLGLELDPNWPLNGQSLGRVFGRDNLLAKTALLRGVMGWVKEDIRDPDRLFLFGVFLHFDNQADKAQTVFEAAYRLAGGGDHLAAFLRPVDPAKPAAGGVELSKVEPPQPERRRPAEDAPGDWPVPPVPESLDPVPAESAPHQLPPPKIVEPAPRGHDGPELRPPRR